VREFTAEDEKRVTIVLDTGSTDHQDDFDERFEHAVVHAASLLKHFIDERGEVRLILGSKVGNYGSGPEHLYENLRRLALVTPETVASDLANERGKSCLTATPAGDEFAIVLTSAPPGSIPARLWRSSHVIYF
jgi:uncharacterized protein (DUF58 family)